MLLMEKTAKNTGGVDLLVFSMLLHMVETKCKNLQDDFVEDFDPVLILFF